MYKGAPVRVIGQRPIPPPWTRQSAKRTDINITVMPMAKISLLA
jgi:hypothetical protein